jgi:hypothetical protein
MVAEATQRSQQIQESRRAAAQLEQRVADQPDWAGLRTQCQHELETAEAVLGQADRTATEVMARQLGIVDLAIAESLLEVQRAERGKLVEADRKLEGELAAARIRSVENQKTLAAAREQLRVTRSNAEEDWEERLPEVVARQAEIQRQLTGIQKELETLTADSDHAVTAAKLAFGNAERGRSAAHAECAKAAEALRVGERLLATAEGEIQMRREVATKLDEGAARAAVEEVESELRLAPAPPQQVTDEMLAEVRARVQSARDEMRRVEDQIHGKRGALQHVGGEVAKQKAETAQEALKAAREREQFLEIDYAAWDLLRSTLLDAEREEGVHLGRALGDPIARRFAELTGCRYGGIALGPDLETHSISTAGGDRLLSSLSVGTRDQLSTIFRLSLAEQLRSAVMLDDQLTQSDAQRMLWLRELMRQLASNIQIIVFTCRPTDYLLADELKTARKSEKVKMFVRSIDLKQVIQRTGATSPLGGSPPGS